jgi:hypothetical protein
MNNDRHIKHEASKTGKYDIVTYTTVYLGFSSRWAFSYTAVIIHYNYNWVQLQFLFTVHTD